jgi:phosphoribosylanthranilate isomerase
VKPCRTRIKMCGTTRQEDAEFAVSLGIDALGFIFVKKSPRWVNREQAGSIIRALPPFITRVGVFVDSDIEEIKDHIVTCGLTQVQLHGNESPEFCQELKRWNRSCSICKAFRIGEATIPDNISLYSPMVDSILLDTFVKGLEGGTGEVFDWKLTDSLKIDRPVILAGGLNPDNVCTAISIVSPFAIDINSGVEKEPGIKDHHLLYQLVQCVRKAESHQSLSS